MASDERIAQLIKDNAELRRNIIQLESKVEISNIGIKSLNDRISTLQHFNMLLLFFLFVAIVAAVYLVIACIAGGTEKIYSEIYNNEIRRRVKEMIDEKVKEHSRNHTKTAGNKR